MKLSFDWLCEFADFSSIPFPKIHEKISLSICEIDDVEEYKEELEKVILVQIEEISPHPESPKLSVCKVSDGSSQYTVVSGANNIQKGNKVALALPGAEIEGKKIAETNFKGIQSSGMLLSEKEIGISEDHSGVKIFPEDAKLGTSLRKLFEWEDKILIIDNKSITHRPDLWSHFGFARELASQLGIPLKSEPLKTDFSFKGKPSIEIRSQENAHAYYACAISQIQIGESQKWVKDRLDKCGIRSISNVVDISNYVMLELGQPTHFFDRAKLGQVSLSIEKNHKEKLALLDETERNIDPEALVIANSGKPIALAGIMGGKDTEVSSETKELVLESAVFRREDIRKGIRKMGLRTEAAIRYEKGLDSLTALPVLKRSLVLLQKNGCPNLIAEEPIGFLNNADKRITIETSFEFLNKKLGKIFPEEQILQILERLGFIILEKKPVLKIQVPSYRHNYDIQIPEDIVEEVGRSIGYAEIDVQPLHMQVLPALLQKERALERRVKHILSTRLAFQEVYNYSFASEEDLTWEGKVDEALSIQNPMPEDSRYLRTSSYPSIVRSVLQNADRFEEVHLFEFGRVYFQNPGSLGRENKFFTLASYRNRKNETFSDLESDLLQFRSQFESLFQNLNLVSIRMKPIERNYLHPKSSIGFYLGEVVLAEMGFLHPEFQDKMELKKRLLVGKIFFDSLVPEVEKEKRAFRFKTPSQFPGDHLDVSLVMEEKESSEKYAQMVLSAGIPEVESIYVHAIYRGENVGSDKKSVTYRISLVTYKETFTQAKIQQITDELLSLAKSSGFQLR